MLSATPSMRPAMGRGVRKISTRKSIRTGTIISLLTSVKKLTMPSTKTLREMPLFEPAENIGRLNLRGRLLYRC